MSNTFMNSLTHIIIKCSRLQSLKAWKETLGTTFQQANPYHFLLMLDTKNQHEMLRKSCDIHFKLMNLKVNSITARHLGFSLPFPPTIFCSRRMCKLLPTRYFKNIWDLPQQSIMDKRMLPPLKIVGFESSRSILGQTVIFIKKSNYLHVAKKI